MTEGMKRDIMAKMAICEEQGCTDTTIRLELSDGKSLDIWYFEEEKCYVWSHSSKGYEDYEALIGDLVAWLSEQSLEAVGVDTV